MKEYFSKDLVNDYSIGVLKSLKPMRVEVLSGLVLEEVTIFLANPEGQSVKDFMTQTINNKLYSYSTIGIYHLKNSMKPTLKKLITQSSQDWFDGMYEDYYPGPHLDPEGSAHLLGFKDLLDDTFLFFSLDIFITSTQNNTLLGDPGFLQEFLNNNRVKVINKGDFSQTSGPNFLSSLSSSPQGQYFQNLLSNAAKIKAITQSRAELEKTVKVSYNSSSKKENKI